MSRHEGVSCDSCMKSNFTDLRYKCLVCYDYDLCSVCYNSGVSSSRHTSDHAMQCILTRADFNLYYGGDIAATVQPQSYTCAYCGKMGFSVALLQEHIQTNHVDAASVEVVCPVCAAHPVGDPNHVTDDLATHLALVHRSPSVEFDDDQLSEIKQIRRLTQAARSTNTGGSGGSSGGSGRTIRGSLLQLIEPNMSAGVTSSSNRDLMDPISELLSHLSSVRGRFPSQGVTSHIQQLEMQLASNRHQQEYLLYHQMEGKTPSSAPQTTRPVESQAMPSKSTPASNAGTSSVSSSTASRSTPQFLLVRSSNKITSEAKKQQLEMESADKSLFVQELVLSSMLENSEDTDARLLLHMTIDSDSSISNPPADEANGIFHADDENFRSVHSDKSNVCPVSLDREDATRKSASKSHDMEPSPSSYV